MRPDLLFALLVATAAGSAMAGEQPNECGKRPPVASTATPKLSKGDVYTEAAKAVKADGRKLTEYEAPSTCFNSGASEWVVVYKGRSDVKAPPARLSIGIHDTTGKARIIPER